MSTTSECRGAFHRGCGFYIWPEGHGPAAPDFCECDCHALPADPLDAVWQVLQEEGVLGELTRLKEETLRERLERALRR